MSNPSTYPLAAGGECAACDANLTCARESAKRGGGVLDHKNVCGCVCHHAVPAKHLFLTSATNENFAQYDAMMWVAVMEELPELQELLLDINCQYSAHCRAQLPSVAARLGFHIGWLHAKAGHNLECQLRFNAMFAAGLGRCFGEGIEQLWAALKAVARIQRYEALLHRMVTLELALHDFAMGKYERCYELLVQTLRHTERRHAHLARELEEALEQAREAGFELAADACFELEVQEAVKLTPPQQYVKKLATKAVYDGLTSRGGSAVIAGLDSATGRALAVQVNDPAFAAKLESDISRLRRQLGIPDGAPDWLPDSTEYQEAAAGLRTTMVRLTETRVERNISFLATLQEDRGAELQSGHNTGLIRDRCVSLP
ncbi:hypothetical protein ABPG75_004872 [Micractinium tetrahymenae]